MNDEKLNEEDRAGKEKFFNNKYYKIGFSAGYLEGIKKGNEIMTEGYTLQPVRYVYCEHCSEKVKKVIKGGAK